MPDTAERLACHVGAGRGVVPSGPPQDLCRAERAGSKALALASDPGRFLSTVQIGITLIGILAGVLSGATLGDRAVGWLTRLGLPEHIAEPLGFGAVVTGITYLSLIIGELVPKQIALRNPERWPAQWLPRCRAGGPSAPLVSLLERSSRFLWRCSGTRPRPSTVTDDEIRDLIADAERHGVLEPGEHS